MEDRVGTNIPDIQELAPTAVQVLGRTNLIQAGLTTDICTSHAAVGALEAGYTIPVVADARGSSATLSDEMTFDRMRAQGATISVGNQIVTELYSDFGTDAGQQAMNINLEGVVSRLA
ncbi:MAG: isochorismatase family protein [Candidatus Saccharibacteria bacterium]|nr:isochorismatase family protein [Microbacteriaceae bacterium]